MATKRKPRKKPKKHHPSRITTAARKRAFLERFRQTGNLTLAMEGIGNRTLVYLWKDQDEEFAAELESAKAEAGDRLEEEARRRAVEGWEEPVFHQGQPAGWWVDENGKPLPPNRWDEAKSFVPYGIRKYDSQLLTLLLKGAKPEKYRERHELTGKDGGPVNFRHDLSGLSDEELLQLEGMARKLKAS
jgi:hypothetical protein